MMLPNQLIPEEEHRRKMADEFQRGRFQAADEFREFLTEIVKLAPSKGPPTPTSDIRKSEPTQRLLMLALVGLWSFAIGAAYLSEHVQIRWVPSPAPVTKGP